MPQPVRQLPASVWQACSSCIVGIAVFDFARHPRRLASQAVRQRVTCSAPGMAAAVDVAVAAAVDVAVDVAVAVLVGSVLEPGATPGSWTLGDTATGVAGDGTAAGMAGAAEVGMGALNGALGSGTSWVEPSDFERQDTDPRAVSTETIVTKRLGRVRRSGMNQEIRGKCPRINGL